MRISDWSSDVCSSDLLAVEVDRGVHHVVDRSNRAPGCVDDATGVGRDGDPAATPLEQGQPEPLLDLADLGRQGRLAEIGRASCGERVGQYVEFLVVAVSLNTKKTIQHQ